MIKEFSLLILISGLLCSGFAGRVEAASKAAAKSGTDWVSLGLVGGIIAITVIAIMVFKKK
jgi:hypothetical protein